MPMKKFSRRKMLGFGLIGGGTMLLWLGGRLESMRGLPTDLKEELEKNPLDKKGKLYHHDYDPAERIFTIDADVNTLSAFSSPHAYHDYTDRHALREFPDTRMRVRFANGITFEAPVSDLEKIPAAFGPHMEADVVLFASDKDNFAFLKDGTIAINTGYIQKHGIDKTVQDVLGAYLKHKNPSLDGKGNNRI